MADSMTFASSGTSECPPVRAGPGEDEQRRSNPRLTSCRRCRKQKLRCSRDLPNCKRCGDMGALCDYPPPPDRKRLAAQRVQNAKSRAHQEADRSEQRKKNLPIEGDNLTSRRSNSAGHSDHAPGLPILRAGHVEAGIKEYRITTPLLHTVLKRTTLPSPEFAVFLFEIYFSRLYNATLLFHKKTFLSDFAANKVPDFVTLSIYALATIFLTSPSGQVHQVGDEDGIDLGISMLSASDSARQGLEWAIAASQRVLMQSDVPRLETVQACQNLALYWFSRGQTDRTHIHTHIAYRTSRLLNLHIQSQTPDSVNVSILLDELKRRCFWSCWMTSCISQENADFKHKPWEAVISLRFPCDEDSFASGTFLSTEFYDKDGNIEPINPRAKPLPSAMGELVKLCSLWWEIQSFVRQYRGDPDSESRITMFWGFDQRLGLILENFHPNFKCENPDSFLSSRYDPYKLFFIQALYRLCVCTLHTSVVPLFSEMPSASPIAKKLVRVSVEESVKHAAFMLDMASVFLSTRPDISRLPSITGYAMFVACTVHFKALAAQRKLHSHGVNRLKGAICIIEGLKEYWATNECLWTALKTLFGSKNVSIDSITRSNTRINISSDDQNIDVEKILSHERIPRDNERTDIYTYITLQEAIGASGRLPVVSSNTSQKSAPNAFDFEKIGSVEAAEQINLWQTSTNDAELRQVSPDARTPALPHRKFSPSLHQTSTVTQSDHQACQQYTSSPQNDEEIHGRNNIVQGSEAEGYQTQESTGGLGQVPMEGQLATGQSTSSRTDISDYPTTGMEIGGVNLWWDQPYEELFEVDPNGLNPPMGGQTFPSFYPYSYML